jgi:tetratricopeptide (TPR) repeat protein
LDVLHVFQHMSNPSHKTAACVLFLLLIAATCFAQPKPSTESFASLSKRAGEARDADHLDEAVVLYKKALALRPRWAEGWWSLGMLEYDRNNYRSAAQAFRRFLPLSPKDADGTAQVMLGLCEFELGRDQAALEHLESGKELGLANNEQLRLVLLYHDGLLLLRAGRFRPAQVSLSALCRKQMQGDEALQDLGLSVLRVLPKDAPPKGTPGAVVVQRVGHAACLAGLKQFDEARQEFSTLVQEYPDYPNIHYAFGRFFVDRDEVPAAIEQFKTEIQNHPEDVNSRLEIAAAEYKLDSQAGLPYAEEAVKLNPRQPFAHYLLGLLYLDTDNYQKALPELETASKAFPKDPKIFMALGSAYARAGRRQEAAQARAKFERLNKQATEDSGATY